MTFIFIIYGLIAGYFAGFIGTGCGLFLMPLYTILNIPYNTAVDASLMAVFASSLISTIHHHKKHGTPWKPCITMSATGAIFAIVGNLYLVHQIPPILLMLLFAGLLFLNVDLLRMLDRRKTIATSLELQNHRKNFIKYLCIGGLAGLAASLLGTGGGIFIVPLLIATANYSTKDAVQTAIPVMVATSFFSLFAEVFRFTLPFHIAIPTIIGTVVGGFLGGIALQYVRPHIILRVNYVISFVLGFTMLVKAFTL